MRIATVLLLALAACTTTKTVRSGRGWADAKPADFKATKADVLREVEGFMKARDYNITYNPDKSYVKGYYRGDNPVEQNIELHVKIADGPSDGLTRVTAISGRSLGIEWKGREVHERLYTHLRRVFG